LNYGHEHNAGYTDIPEGIEHIWQEPTIHIDYDHGDSIDYHPYDENIWKIKDNTKLIIPCCQDARYLEGYRDKICEWLQYKPDFEEQCKKYLNFRYDENLCIINVRGGEYKFIPNVLLSIEYYYNAMETMLNINPNMNFYVITDDMEYASKILPRVINYHFGIGADYYVLNHVQNLILSNSSFAILPTFTNKAVQNIIAPAYWSRYNVSTGYWPSDMWTFKDHGWNFIDRKGEMI
jgi:hypothetical protein